MSGKAISLLAVLTAKPGHSDALRQALRAEWATDRYFRYSFDENITPSAGIVEKSGRC